MPQRITSFRIDKNNKLFKQMKPYDKHCSCGEPLPYYRTTCTDCISIDIRILVFKHQIKAAFFKGTNSRTIPYSVFKFNN